MLLKQGVALSSLQVDRWAIPFLSRWIRSTLLQWVKPVKVSLFVKVPAQTRLDSRKWLRYRSPWSIKRLKP